MNSFWRSVSTRAIKWIENYYRSLIMHLICRFTLALSEDGIIWHSPFTPLIEFCEKCLVKFFLLIINEKKDLPGGFIDESVGRIMLKNKWNVVYVKISFV